MTNAITSHNKKHGYTAFCSSMLTLKQTIILAGNNIEPDSLFNYLRSGLLGTILREQTQTLTHVVIYSTSA